MGILRGRLLWVGYLDLLRGNDRQMNWKTSNRWELKNVEKIAQLISQFRKLSLNKYEMELFKGTTSFS